MSAIEETRGIENYAAPVTLDEALEVLAGGATVVAGGTDLMVQAGAGAVSYRPTLLNIRRIAGLGGTSGENGRVRIGALTTITEVRENALLAAEAPALVAAADHFASDQIRNAATIGGNICNASPAGDTIVPLLLLDAEVELACWQGSVSLRNVALSDFFTGPGATVKASNELLTAVSFALPASGSVARFTKSGPRPALEISTVAAGISGVWAGGALAGVRVALGAVAPTPVRARATEAFLEGKVLDDATVAGAAETALGDCAPIDDVRASAWYRNHLVKIYIQRMLDDVRNS
jgi:CO/xanthine dehydrogenase FAD-binding subunit